MAELRSLREAMRALLTANVTGSCEQSALDVINSSAAAASMIVVIDGEGRTTLRPHSHGVRLAVSTLLAIVHDAQTCGDWPRLKGCRQCGYVFYDFSKNRSATWCSMSICGNRAKNRAHYQRVRDLPPETSSATRRGA